MAHRKIQTYQNKANNLCTIYFLFDLTVNANALKQSIIVNKEIGLYSWLLPFCKQNLNKYQSINQSEIA